MTDRICRVVNETLRESECLVDTTETGPFTVALLRGKELCPLALGWFGVRNLNQTIRESWLRLGSYDMFS